MSAKWIIYRFEQNGRLYRKYNSPAWPKRCSGMRNIN
jgi:hypothetical protein